METLLQAYLRLGSKQFTHSFGLPEFDQLFENGIQCGEVSELATEECCGVSDFCHQLIAQFLQDPTKINEKLIYLDSNKTFSIERLKELIQNDNAKNLGNLKRIEIKQVLTIDELHKTLFYLPAYLKHNRASLMIINTIYGCILSQELLVAQDYASSIENILFKLKKLAKEEGIAILTINALIKPDNCSDFVPLLGNKWLKHISRRVSLHPDNFVSNMVKKPIYYAIKYDPEKTILPKDIVRYRKTERGIEIYKL